MSYLGRFKLVPSKSIGVEGDTATYIQRTGSGRGKVWYLLKWGTEWRYVGQIGTGLIESDDIDSIEWDKVDKEGSDLADLETKDYDDLDDRPVIYTDDTVDKWELVDDDENVGFTFYDETNWDDLQVSISNVRIPTSNAPTWRLYDHGITSGVTFPALGFALNEYIYFDVQSTHSMKLSTVLEHHIHYTTPTDGTGDKFKFQLDVIAAPVAGQWAVPTGSPFTAETTMSGDYSDDHILFDIATIPAVNTSVSTLYKCKLTRIAATADEYSGEVYIEFTDCHYKKDTVGSRTDSLK